MFGYKSKKTKLAEKKAKQVSDELDRVKKDENDKILFEAKQIIAEKRASELKAKEEPFLNLKGLIQQADGKIKIDLDWDDNFIQRLKEAGYTGPDENAIIQKYLLELTAGISDDMGGESDYE